MVEVDLTILLLGVCEGREVAFLVEAHSQVFLFRLLDMGRFEDVLSTQAHHTMELVEDSERPQVAPVRKPYGSLFWGADSVEFLV